MMFYVMTALFGVATLSGCRSAMPLCLSRHARQQNVPDGRPPNLAGSGVHWQRRWHNRLVGGVVQKMAEAPILNKSAEQILSC